MDKASQVYKKIKNTPTSQAIDALSKEWFNRKPPKGIRKEKAEVVFFKRAGILDRKANKMAPDLWLPDGSHLLPNVRDHIMKVVYRLAPKESVKQIVLIGSTTGLRYTSKSDVDVNAVLDPPSLVEELWEERRKYNDKNIPGTSHPLNLYLQGMRDEIPGYQDSYFGVYDVLADEWLVNPPDESTYRRVEDKFWAELTTVRMLANEFMRRADNYENSLKDIKKYGRNPWKIITLENRIQRDLKQLISFIEELQLGRDFAYNWGWGSPRVGYRNILYKFMHKRLPIKYQIILEDVEEIIHQSKANDAGRSGSSEQQQ